MNKIFSIKAYHSTRQKGLKKFESRTTTATIDTGEGAHVHGWGLYLQADEMANRKDYLDMFTGYPSDIGEDYKVHAWDSDFMAYHTEDAGQIDEWNFFNVFTFDGNLLPESELVITLKLNGYTNNEITYFLTELLEKAEEDEDYYSDVLIHWSEDEIRKAAEKAKYLHDYEVEPLGYKDPDPLPDGTHFEGASQYTVEIPDDMIFIDEDKPIDISLVKIWVEYMSSIGVFKKEKISEPNAIDTYAKRFDNGRQFYNEISQWFKSQEKGSLWLSEHGIDGMAYNGGRDGICYVIYNCDKLKIIAEY